MGVLGSNGAANDYRSPMPRCKIKVRKRYPCGVRRVVFEVGTDVLVHSRRQVSRKSRVERNHRVVPKEQGGWSGANGPPADIQYPDVGPGIFDPISNVERWLPAAGVTAFEQQVYVRGHCRRCPCGTERITIYPFVLGGLVR